MSIARPLVALLVLGCARRSPPPTCPESTPNSPPLADSWGPRPRARVFLSGHSLLDSPLPELVAELAASQHADYGYEYQMLFGSPIRARSKGEREAPGYPGYRTGRNRSGENLDVVAELRDPKRLGTPGDHYDTLIITERHDVAYVLWLEDTTTYLRHFHDRFIDGNPQGRTFLYHPWLDLDKAAPQTWIEHEKKAIAAWECVASKVNQGLAAEKRTDRVNTLPAGLALVELVEAVLAGKVPGLTGAPEAQLGLIFRDDVHLTRLGNVFMADVLYAAIFGRPPEGAPEGVAPETATAFQRIAWQAVSGYYARPPRQRTMEDCRCLMTSTVCPSFFKLDAATARLRPAPPVFTRLKERVRGLLGKPDGETQCQQIFGDATAPTNPFH
jgi:hypothetical protein